MKTAPATPPVPAGPTAAADPAPAASSRDALTPARGLVRTAAVFVVAVAAVMVAGQIARPKEEPWRSKELNATRLRLLEDPKNEELKKTLREQDLHLRQAYFGALERNRTGTWLLVVAGVGLVWLAREIVRARPAPATPTHLSLRSLGREQAVTRSRLTVIVTGGVCGLGLLALGLADHSQLNAVVPAGAAAAASAVPSRAHPEAPAPTGGSPAPISSAPAGPAPDVWAKNWPQFRGPLGSGIVTAGALPMAWDIASGKGVVWRTNLSLAGYSSPVVWEGRVFLTGGDKKARLVFCFDAASGALRWQKPVTPANAPAVATDPPEQSGAAASTVATDGARVFAIFAAGDLGALDFDGKLVWHRKLDFSENGYGHASSLVVWRDRLIVQADQGQAEEGKSTLTAFDTATGNPVWTAKRPVGGSWATPLLVAQGDATRIVTAGDPLLMAHDAATGAEVWRASVLGGELAPSPVFADGLVVAASPGKVFLAVRADGTGDVTESKVAWKLEKEVPDVPSPIAAGGLLYTVNTEGLLICRELTTGQKVWEHAFEMEFQASPLLAGDRLYLFAQGGDVFVVGTGREYRELATSKMNDEIQASPAVAGDRLFVRTKKTLYCLGAAAGPTQVADVR